MNPMSFHELLHAYPYHVFWCTHVIAWSTAFFFFRFFILFLVLSSGYHVSSSLCSSIPKKFLVNAVNSSFITYWLGENNNQHYKVNEVKYYVVSWFFCFCSLHLMRYFMIFFEESTGQSYLKMCVEFSQLFIYYWDFAEVVIIFTKFHLVFFAYRSFPICKHYG